MAFPLSLAAALLQVSALLFPQGSPATPDLSPPGNGEPVRMQVGIYLVDMFSVDGSDQTFRADVLTHLVWQDERLADPDRTEARAVALGDAWYPSVEVVNRRTAESTLQNSLTVDPDGTVSYVQRWVGTFSLPMSLREFPLDRQRFYIQIVVGGGADRDRLELVTPQSPNVLAGRSEALSISDWRLGDARVEKMPMKLGTFELDGVALIVEGRRQLRYYIVQIILPLMMIVTMAYAVFWIDPAVIPTRVGTVVTTMLTLIAYRFALSSLVPRLPYLTRLDWFTMGSTTLVLSTLMAMAVSAYFKSRGNDTSVQRIDHIGRFAFPAAAIVIWTLPWLL